MRVGVPPEEQHLEEQHAGGPHAGHAAEPGKNEFRNEWLDLKQQKSAQKDRERVNPD
jgi:hypothetical protein